MPDKTITWQFEELLNWLREQKPNDRSDKDRYFAIVITDVEKAKAVYMAYCERPDEVQQEAVERP